MRQIVRVAAVTCALAGLTGCWTAPGQGPGRRSHNDYETGFAADTVADFTELWSATTDETTFRGVGHPVLSTDGGVHVTTTRSVYSFDPASGAQRWVSGVGTTYEEVDTDAFVWNDQLWTSVRHSGVEWEPAYCSLTTGSCDTYGGEVMGRLEGMRGNSESPSILLSEFLPLTAGGTAHQARDYFGAAGVLLTEQPNQSRLTLGTTQFFHAGVGVGTAPANGVRAFPRAGGSGWATTIDGTDATSPVLSADGTTVFVGTDAGTVYALATADGSVLWSAHVGEGVGPPPALAGGILYVPTRVGTLVALSASGCGAPTCPPLWSAAETSAIVVQPAVAAGVVFTGSVDGTVHAYDAAGCGAASCRALWSAATGSRITGAPAVSLGKVFVGTQDGRVIAYGLPPA